MLTLGLVLRRQERRSDTAALPQGTTTWWPVLGVGVVLIGVSKFAGAYEIWILLVGVMAGFVAVAGMVTALVRRRRDNRSDRPDTGPSAR